MDRSQFAARQRIKNKQGYGSLYVFVFIWLLCVLMGFYWAGLLGAGICGLLFPVLVVGVPFSLPSIQIQIGRKDER